MKRERDADAGHGPEGADAGELEPEPEGEAKEEFYDTTPVKTTGLSSDTMSLYLLASRHMLCRAALRHSFGFQRR